MWPKVLMVVSPLVSLRSTLDIGAGHSRLFPSVSYSGSYPLNLGIVWDRMGRHGTTHHRKQTHDLAKYAPKGHFNHLGNQSVLTSAPPNQNSLPFPRYDRYSANILHRLVLFFGANWVFEVVPVFDGDRVLWSQLTWISGAMVRLL